MAIDSEDRVESDRSENGEIENKSSPSVPENEAREPSQITFSIALEPGTRIRITVESTAKGQSSVSAFTENSVEVSEGAETKPAEAKVFVQSESATGEVQTLPIQPLATNRNHFLINLGAFKSSKKDAKTKDSTAPALQVIEKSHRTIKNTLKLPNKPVINLSGLRRLFPKPLPRLPIYLFTISLVIYMIMHVVGLIQFPIYFSCDESASTLQAADLVSNHMIDFRGDLLPTFFQNGGQFNLSTTVYIQMIPYLLFGDSDWLVRFITGLISLLAVFWMARILKDIFHQSYWWSAVLLLGITPTWFLHTRTGFEVAIMVTFFTGFLYYYLLYRFRNPHYLYLALFLGALAFYAYTPGEIIMVAMGLFLLASDWRYHWEQRKTTLLGFGLLLLLAAPLVRFLIQHPNDYMVRLSLYGSYVVGTGSIFEKIGTYALNWISGFNPFFWFFPNDQNIPIYSMKGYGNIAWPILPFVLLGFWQMIKRLRKSEYRLILFAILAAPTGGAIATVDINRALVMVIPVILLAALGLEFSLEWIKKKLSFSREFLSIVTILVLSAAGLLMLRDALVNGPTWYTDYGMSKTGMQYGARQVFTNAYAYSQKHPDEQIYISPNWAFRTEDLLRFYYPQHDHMQISTADAFINQIQPDIDKILFVLTPDDYQKVIDSNLFKYTQPIEILSLPNGQPGFYFTHLVYRDDVQQVMANIVAARHQLEYATIQIDDQPVKVGYSKLDEGPIENAFDGDPNTYIKTIEANPLTLELNFSQAHTLSSVTLLTGSESVQITVTLTVAGQSQTLQYKTQSNANQPYKNVTVTFPTTQNITQLKIELLDVLVPEPTTVHLWEVTLK